MKISIIMQSYLGDYPNARVKPEEGFIRAIYSVINQTVSDWELIIVADGCNISEKLYNDHFKHYNNIKFKKVSKPDKTGMYNQGEKGRFKRGYPRKVGVSMATGDWICYLDSDDFFVKNAIAKLIIAISSFELECEKSNQPEPRYLINKYSIENYLQRYDEENGPKKGNLGFKFIGEPFKIDGLPDLWTVSTMIYRDSGEHALLLGTLTVVHKNGYPSWEWGDVSEGFHSEDTSFIIPMMQGEDRKHLHTFKLPYYVRCHKPKEWDY
jgi:glycosyltransferase involved in cell wall biosynthesis